MYKNWQQYTGGLYFVHVFLRQLRNQQHSYFARNFTNIHETSTENTQTQKTDLFITQSHYAIGAVNCSYTIYTPLLSLSLSLILTLDETKYTPRVIITFK